MPRGHQQAIKKKNEYLTCAKGETPRPLIHVSQKPVSRSKTCKQKKKKKHYPQSKFTKGKLDVNLSFRIYVQMRKKEIIFILN